MASKGIICTTNNVEYIAFRKAQIGGARTLEELKSVTGACGDCEGCGENLDHIMSMLCGCKNVTFQDVLTAISNGADTADKVAEITGAGTDCGKCKALVANVIELGR